MKIDPTFLRQVQTAGWRIAGATMDKVLAQCPTAGCPVKVTFAPGQQIRPACQQMQTNSDMIIIRNFDDARLPLRAQRKRLGLTIRDVEDIAGMPVDFLAKFEKDEPSKYPNAQTYLDWAPALGYVNALIPEPMPLYGLRIIAETRDLAQARMKAQARLAQHQTEVLRATV